MQFTTVRSKEKDYDIYLKSEKLVHSQQEHEKCFTAIGKWKKLVPSYFEPEQTLLKQFSDRKKWIPAIWRSKKCSSQLLGARKKIMTSI